MNRAVFVIPLLLVFIRCASSTPGDWKTIDVGPFQLTVPPNWKYEDPGQQEDSFIGQIAGPHLLLSFDCSDMGYANHLLPTEQEYLSQNEWKRECYFCKPNITYTADFNVKNEKAAQMKKLGTTDSTRVHVEAYPDRQTKTVIHLPTSDQKSKFPKADYIADLTFRDSTIHIPIELPAAYKTHNIQLDSDNRYVYKTIWPKVAGKGMTGVYIHSRTSPQNFQMNGTNLSAEDQTFALQSFKTIQLKIK